MSNVKNARKGAPADYVKEGDGFADITLTRARKFNGIEQTVVRMRETTVADGEAYQDSKDGEATREINMFANLCGVAPDDIRALPLREYARFQAAFALFTN